MVKLYINLSIMIEKTIILQSGKCAWARCFACGWGRLVGPEPNIHRLKADIDREFSKIKKNEINRLKIFASGSFLDTKQFPRSIWSYLVRKCKEKNIQELVIESRPEFITEQSLQDFSGIELIVAIGLEVADNEILKKYNKGFAVEDYIRAANILKTAGCKLRTYLMVGLPFVKNQKISLKKSIVFARKYSQEIVLINTFPHSAAPLFDMWISGKWKPLDKKQFNGLVKQYKNCEKDFNNFMFVPRFPKEKRVLIKGASEKELLHPYYKVWQDYFCRFYEPKKEKNIALFIPCAFRKPYPSSKLHKAIFSVLRNLKIWPKLHPIVISSPGVIPYEFSNYYPFNSYDWPEWEETADIKKKYVSVTQKRIESYLLAHKNYKKFYCYLKPDSESCIALRKACKKLKIKLVECLRPETYEKIKSQKNPLSLEEALKDLAFLT